MPARCTARKLKGAIVCIISSLSCICTTYRGNLRFQVHITALIVSVYSLPDCSHHCAVDGASFITIFMAEDISIHDPAHTG